MSPRRLWALVDGLPYDQAAFRREERREDRQRWNSQDEWSARIIESLEHWGPLSVMALSGAQGSKIPHPQRLFDHPDRPEPVGGKGASKPMSVAEFEKSHKSKQRG